HCRPPRSRHSFPTRRSSDLVVSAGQYLGRLLNEIAEMGKSSLRVDPFQFAIYFGVVVTIYFWWSNTKGIHESSGKALRIMQITTDRKSTRLNSSHGSISYAV